MRPPRPARAWFLLLAIAVPVWWTSMALLPAARGAFTPGGFDEAKLWAWAPADLLLLTPASLLAAFPPHHRPAFAVVLPWGVTAALGYATAWCLAASALRGGGWWAGAAMAAATIGSAFAARAVTRDAGTVA